ncbi:TIM23 complex component [Mortierella hygrophila]|uniref:Presequence translocated-associated motor subunit PAM17 n=1 Tax=Mortierella hygrophila TaxID=979708 RepID=A0A9P6FGY8_9FUNG|nr:TIM23 complex component [Mortierella hygrophila]
MAVAPCRFYSTSKRSNIAGSIDIIAYANGIEASFFSNLNRTHHLVERKSMDWNSYFALRGTRRLYERVFMVPSTLLGLLGGGYYFAHRDFDPTMSIFGLDQVVVYGLGAVGVGLVGSSVGSIVGNMIFRAVHANARPLLDKMDREFFNRIVLNRANPTGNPLTHPIPDFYGEKIKSVHDYRTWLRKQREYHRKAMYFV